MKTVTLIILSILTISACQNDTPDYTQLDEVVPVKETKDLLECDSTEEAHSTEAKVKPDSQKIVNKDKPESPAVDIIDIDDYIQDPFKDPDYIGTPCGNYLDGKCTRHNHHKDEFIEQSKIELDSLKH